MVEQTNFELKKLAPEAIPKALERAMRYRLLNQPLAAESIYRDILIVDEENQEALTNLILALTDQFLDHQIAEPFELAKEMVEKLKTEYEQAYYLGLICERRGNAHRRQAKFNSGSVAYDWYRQAMTHYERAETLAPPDNNEAILRWNSCVRVFERFSSVRPEEPDDSQGLLLE